MKKVLLSSLLMFLVGGLMQAQTTATDFSANDCGGSPHHLFADLDAGKIVVITFVMPCVSCIGPSQTANSTVQGFAASNPGKVIFYMAVNHGAPTCSVLTTWAGDNDLMGVTCFSDTSLRMTDYGTMAMNKTVVLTGTDHKVVFTQDYSLDTTSLKNAINEAINPASVAVVTGNAITSLFPNPAANKISVSYTLKAVQKVSIDIVNAGGKIVKTIVTEKNTAGQNTINIDLKQELPNGLYFVNLNVGGSTEMMKFTISR